MSYIQESYDWRIILDYAHNPFEIEKAIMVAQSLAHRVIAVWQPTGFSPLSLFGDDLVRLFLTVPRKTDMVFLTQVYYAGGTVNREVDSEAIISCLEENGASNAYLCMKDSLVETLTQLAKPGDLFLIMGARDVHDIANDLSKGLRDKLG